jgi:hypothetical protein
MSSTNKPRHRNSETIQKCNIVFVSYLLTTTGFKCNTATLPIPIDMAITLVARILQKRYPIFGIVSRNLFSACRPRSYSTPVFDFGTQGNANNDVDQGHYAHKVGLPHFGMLVSPLPIDSVN